MFVHAAIKKFTVISVLLFLFTHAYTQQLYPVISYLKIKVDSMGNLPQNPYVVTLQNKNKHLVVIGTQHTFDTTSPVFSIIEKAFTDLQPEIVINEGGNLTKTYISRNSAIVQNAELGLEKYLADKTGIKTCNGDEPEKMEFEELSKAYSKEEALVQFASERFIFPYAFGQYSGDLERDYDSLFIKNYLDKEGIELTPEEKSFSYYKNLYKKYFHQDFALDKISMLDFAPFGTRNHFNEVTRKSKELRDAFLCKQIEEELKLYNRVLVVFGGWHVLAIEPALTQIVSRVN